MEDHLKEENNVYRNRYREIKEMDLRWENISPRSKNHDFRKMPLIKLVEEDERDEIREHLINSYEQKVIDCAIEKDESRYCEGQRDLLQFLLAHFYGIQYRYQADPISEKTLKEIKKYREQFIVKDEEEKKG